MSMLRPLCLLCLTVLIAACNSVPPEANGASSPTTTDAEAARPIGGDRDAHGCLTAAGYAWCERERACVRPWELAKDKGFENSASGYDAWCGTEPAAAP